MSVRTVDIHAHFYPATDLDTLADEGYRRGAIYATTATNADASPSAQHDSVHDMAFTDIDQRLARIDVHALSLPPPDAFANDPAVAYLAVQSLELGLH